MTYPDGTEKIFTSIASAAKETGLNKDLIKRMSLDGTKRKGYRIKTLEQPKTKRSRGVIVTDIYGRNIAFKSAEEAAQYVGVKREELNKSLRSGELINGFKVRGKMSREDNLYCYKSGKEQ